VTVSKALTNAIRGSCLCGDFRFEIRGPILPRSSLHAYEIRSHVDWEYSIEQSLIDDEYCAPQVVVISSG
jgi:hypothetical protein